MSVIWNNEILNKQHIKIVCTTIIVIYNNDPYSMNAKMYFVIITMLHVK